MRILYAQKSSNGGWTSVVVVLMLAMSDRVMTGMVLSNIRDINYTQHRALHQLLEVYDMEQAERKHRHYTPPQYMLDLYNSIADSGGITRTLSSHPYEADIVRSFPDRDLFHHHRFFFNITAGIPAKEQLLEAEFHLYKIKPGHRKGVAKEIHSHLLEIKLYQIMSEDNADREDGNKLLHTRRVSLESSGWEVFYVKSAVLDWLRNHSCNHGLLLSVKTILGLPVGGNILRFDKRHRHHSNKQPILVLFTRVEKSRQKHTNSLLGDREYGYWELTSNKESSDPQTVNSGEHFTQNATDENIFSSRKKRSVPEQEDTEMEEDSEEPEMRGDEEMLSEQGGCSRQEMYVDFYKLGWSSWIISPNGYHAYYCRGSCSFPLGQNQRPTNHATVQSIVHELNLTPEVGLPCCVPNKLYPINLLYFGEQDNVILRQFEDMVVLSCGCH